MGMVEVDHICVCVCTYKRPELLEQLLAKLERQRTGDSFSYSVVVVDNDIHESARRTVESFAMNSVIPARYFVEKEQNIALARNRAVANAQGEFIAFIDDDESPIDDWLQLMRDAIIKYGVDGVLGPVKSVFEVAPPE